MSVSYTLFLGNDKILYCILLVLCNCDIEVGDPFNFFHTNAMAPRGKKESIAIHSNEFDLHNGFRGK